MSNSVPGTNARYEVSERTKLHRLPQRGVFDKQQVFSILDEAMICHIGFVSDGQMFVIPTIYGRQDDIIYIHGAPASRMLKNLQTGEDVCVTVTLVDGLVLARSAFHHSMNYRSVVIFSRATLVESDEEKVAALYAISEHVIPGRWNDVRMPNQKELDGTSVLKLILTEASAKVRTGPPADDQEDLDLPVWAGELPFRVTTQAPIADKFVTKNTPIPDYISLYSRSAKGAPIK